MSSTLALAIANFSKPLIIKPNTSRLGIGVVLLQDENLVLISLKPYLYGNKVSQLIRKNFRLMFMPLINDKLISVGFTSL